MNSLALKIIALTAMVMDHMGAAFPEIFGIQFRIIGRLAFPIYVFLIAEGFLHTRNCAKFLGRLFVFAIISEPFFDVVLNGASVAEISFFADTNIFYTLFLGGVAVVAYQSAEKWRDEVSFYVRAFVPLLICMWLAEAVLGSDYGAYGVVFIFVVYQLNKSFRTRNDVARMYFVVFALLCLIPYVELLHFAFRHGFDAVPAAYWLMIPATIAAVVPVALYNGKRGPNSAFVKWFFYASYPLHLAVLAVLMIHS